MFFFLLFLQKNLFEDNGRGNEKKRKYETGVRKPPEKKSVMISKGKQVEMVTKEGEVSDSEGEVSDRKGKFSGSEENKCQLIMEDEKSDMDWLKSKVSKTTVNTFLQLVVKVNFQCFSTAIFSNLVKP